MMLDVRHLTRYRYENAAIFSQHLLRLTPGSSASQRVTKSDLRITPEPDNIERHHDMFGNTVHVATISHPHDELEIESTSRIDRSGPNGLILEASVPWETVRDKALGSGGFSPNAVVAPFAFPSQMTAPDRAIEAYAAESFPEQRPLLAGTEELSRRINADFAYEPGATAADTPPSESFAERRGVCQDFAHVMLTGLRALRIPARYVSGYLCTSPPPGRERLQGADASHAWVSVWEPAYGWIDFDPTNACLPGEDHIELAHGRDFGDVSPVSGFVVGAGDQELTVGVDVIETDR